MIQKSDWIGGVTTFLTMSYIVVVNPSILSSPGTSMTFQGVLTATVLLCVCMGLLMGLYAKLPYAVAPGLGINAFFTYTIVLGKQVPWPTALGVVFWSGVLFVLASITPLREKIVKAIPKDLRLATAVGIGLFICFIGLKNMGFVTSDPNTIIKLAHFDQSVWLGLLGLGLMIYLSHQKNPFSFLLGICVVTLISLLSGAVMVPDVFFSMPDFKTMFLKLDIWAALNMALLPAIVSIFFTDLFDSISTFVGVSQACDMLDENGDPKNLKQGLMVDALATLFAGLFGTSSGTAYIESASGIEAGGKTGKSAVVTALCFIPCFFIGPLVAMIPPYATGPVLVYVGYKMFLTIKQIDFQNPYNGFPAFVAIVLIPLSFSITQGILWGFITHVLFYWLYKKQVTIMMYVIALISVALIVMEQVYV